ncbi:MAG: hypothetical protein HYT93_02360 [Parcubacteria group bacterium]|nr:hypothetical protein [Parcubacteria group bacterium]
MTSFIKKTASQIAIISVFFLIAGFTAHAQIAPSINISITPGEPRAYEDVLVALESFSINLNTARISWRLNNKLEQDGVGKTTFTFKTGELGSVSMVQITINTENEIIERNFEVHPAEVDLVWEAFTYAPPFYKGKSLASSKSRIKIAAIPHFISENGKKISSNSLIYTWQQDRRVLGSFSGTGKESIFITAPGLFQTSNISVSVSSQDGIYKARSAVVIESRNPEIIFYEKHPTEGIKYDNALGPQLNLSQEEITLRAEPYFFSGEDFASRKVNFGWSLNSNSVESSEKINEITLKRDTAGGIAQVALEIKNAINILQEAAAELIIRF